MKKQYHILGLMSGTSLDGLDMAFCEFSKETEWSFGLIDAVTIPYSEQWKERLRKAHLLNPSELMILHHELGVLHGELVQEFLSKQKISADCIASHGHTVVHDPSKGYTLQIGNAHDIAQITGTDVIADFRSLDVANGGQGAPLVPIGDEKLFQHYDACLNLGGIANISFKHNNLRVAFDISLCNILLNAIAGKLGLDFDENGQLAEKGSVLLELLEKWNAQPFFHRNFPKSLGREFFEESFLKDIISHEGVEDLMRTAVEHIIVQLADVINHNDLKSVLVTGGGAKNGFLISQLRKRTTAEIAIPSDELVDFKEAIVFGFLAALKLEGEVNVLSSVTGAKSDAVVGILYSPARKKN